MSRKEKLLRKAQRGAKLSFAEAILLARWFGFILVRTSGSHHIFRRGDVDELLNLQDKKGEAKDYQVRQLLALVEAYGLTMDSEETGQEGADDEQHDER